jgi:diguanylate cyclase (GGDEF)-like protein
MIELQRELDRSHRSGDPLVVAFLDVDGLKRINDEQGHEAGDEALRAVAEVLRTRMRSYDVIMRFGGDEFVCAQPGLAMAEATARLVRVRAQLSTAARPVFVTFGLAELRPDDSVETFVGRADTALYKERRRARTTPRQPERDRITFPAQPGR